MSSPTPTPSPSATPSPTLGITLVPAATLQPQQIFTWGINTGGQLSDGTAISRSVPSQIIDTSSSWIFVAASTAGGAAIKSDNTLWLWGVNNSGQLGINNLLNQSSLVQTVAGGTNWYKVSCSNSSTAAIKNDNTLWVWGDNLDGELGDGTRILRSSPVQITGSWFDVSMSRLYCVAIRTDGTLWSWGNNSDGQLGIENTNEYSSPVQVGLDSDWYSVAETNSLVNAGAIKSDGSLWLWGNNSEGQLGDGSGSAKSSPVQTSIGGNDWASAVIEETSVFLKKTDGTFWVIGANNLGQLGVNNTTPYATPAQNPILTGSYDLVGASSVLNGNTIYSFSANGYGQVGNNSKINVSSPVVVGSNVKWSYISKSFSNSVALGALFTPTPSPSPSPSPSGTAGSPSPTPSPTDTPSPTPSPSPSPSGSASPTPSTTESPTPTPLPCISISSQTAITTTAIANQGYSYTNDSYSTGGATITFNINCAGDIRVWATIDTGSSISGSIGVRTTSSGPIAFTPFDDTTPYDVTQTFAVGGVAIIILGGAALPSAPNQMNGEIYYTNLHTPSPTPSNSPSPTPSESPSPTPSNSPSPTPSVTLSPSPTPSNSPSPTPSESPSPTPSNSPSPTPSNSPSPTPSESPSPTPSNSPSPTPSESPSPTPSNSPSPTPSESPSPTPSNSPSPTPSESPSPTPSNSPSPTPSESPSPTPSNSPSPTPSESPSPTPSPSPSPSNSSTPSPTPSPSPSGSASPTPSESPSPTPTPSISASPTPTPTATLSASNNLGIVQSQNFDTTATTLGWTASSQSFTGPITFTIEWVAEQSGYLEYSFDASAINPADATVKFFGNNIDPAGQNFVGTTINGNFVRYEKNQTIKIVVNYTSVGFKIADILNFGPGGVTGYVNWYANPNAGGYFWLWGDNADGQLGNNTTISASSPVQSLVAGPVWYAASLGGKHAGGITVDGNLWLWGSNSYGQLGNSSVINQSSPVQTVAGTDLWISLSCGYATTAAIKTDNSLWLWGKNTTGNFGNNTVVSESSPIQTISGGNNWQSVSVGYNHVAAIKTNNTLWLWGLNTNGQLGTNSIISTSSPVQTSLGGSNWVQVSAGQDFTLALKQNGQIYVFGLNSTGQLGDGTYVSTSVPTQITPTANSWFTLKAGSSSSIAIGDYNAPATPSPTPSVTLSPTPTSSVTPTPTETLSPTPSGTSSPTPTESASPTPSATLSPTPTSSVTPTPTETLSPTPSGTSSPTPTESASPTPTATLMPTPSGGYLYLWGQNAAGQLSQDNTISSSNPLQILGNTSNWTQIAAGTNAGGAIKYDGTLWTWGNNSAGELGIDDTVSRSTAVQIASLTGFWMSLSLGQRNMGGIVRIQPTPTVTPTPTGTNATPIPTESPTNTPSATVTLSPSPTPSMSLSPTPTPSMSRSPTPTPSLSGSATPTPSPTASPTLSATSTPSPTSSGTPTPTPSGTGRTPTPTATNSPTPTPTASAPAGSYYLYGWGSAENGEVGNNYAGIYGPKNPVLIGIKQWKTLGIMSAIRADGTLWSWGLNGSATVPLSISSSPIQWVGTDANWEKCSFLSGTKNDGTLYYWGEIKSFLTATESNVVSSPVQNLGGGNGWTNLNRTFDESILAMKGNQAYIWGNDICTRLGVINNCGCIYPKFSSPIQLASPPYKNINPISGSNRGIVDQSGKVYVWGPSDNGLIGNATTNYYDPICGVNVVSAPAMIFTDKTFTKVSFSNGHAAGILTDGTLWSWGSSRVIGNFNPEYNVTYDTGFSSPVQETFGSSDWEDVYCAGFQTVARKKDGTLWGWGSNSGETLGVGDPYTGGVPQRLTTAATSDVRTTGNQIFIFTEDLIVPTYSVASRPNFTYNKFNVTYGSTNINAGNIASNNSDLPFINFTLPTKGFFSFSIIFSDMSGVNPPVSLSSNYVMFRMTVRKNSVDYIADFKPRSSNNTETSYKIIWELDTTDLVSCTFVNSPYDAYPLDCVRITVNGLDNYLI